MTQFHEYFFREINFKGSCQTQFHDFFREINCKASCLTHFHDFFRESFPICIWSVWFQFEWLNLIKLKSAIVYDKASKIDLNLGVYFVVNEY